MAKCDHPGATCIVGQFWTCTTAGCPNGPTAAPTAPQPSNTTLRDYVRTIASRWLQRYADPGIALVHQDGELAMRVMTNDSIELRVRRKDPFGSTWGALVISDGTLANVARDPRRLIPGFESAITTTLCRLQDEIHAAPPGSGCVWTFYY